jgi:hypothetical protein
LARSLLYSAARRFGMSWREFAEVVGLLAVFTAAGLLLGLLVRGTAP